MTQADQVKNRTFIKSNLKNQIDPKTNYKISYQKISMKHFEQIMFNQISNLISMTNWEIPSETTSNKHYWPKTGRSSQKQNIEKQSKTKLIQKQITKFPTISMNHLEQIMFNQISNLIPIEKNFLLKQHNKSNTIDQKQADQVKNRTFKSNFKNQINPKTNYKISYQMISMKHLEQIMFNQISKLIVIPIEKNFLLKQHNK